MSLDIDLQTSGNNQNQLAALTSKGRHDCSVNSHLFHIYLFGKSETKWSTVLLYGGLAVAGIVIVVGVLLLLVIYIILPKRKNVRSRMSVRSAESGLE